jgi:hypothetical protein
MRTRLLTLLIAGAAVLPGTARAQILTSPPGLVTPYMSGAPGVRPSLPVVHLGYTFPAGANGPYVSGFVPASFAPAAAADQGYRTALAIQASSFPPRRYGSIVTMGALTAAYPALPPAGTVTAVNSPSGTTLIPLQSTPYFSSPLGYYGGFAPQPLRQDMNVPYTSGTSVSVSQTPVLPWSAYSGPLRRSFMGY